MRNDHAARATPVLLLCLLISGGFTATHLFAPPSASTIMHAFRNALHAPGFAVLAVTLFLLLMSFFDNDVLPGLKHKLRFVVLAGGLILLGANLLPAVSISHALVARAAALPELISFDHVWERVLYRSYGGAAVTRIPLGDDEGLVAVVSMGRAQYSGLVIEPYPDWRGYTALGFSILTLGEEHHRMTLRIDDVAHNGQYADRFNRVVEIDSTMSEFVVPLSEISALENGRRLRLDAVRSMMFFMINTDGSEKIIINDIRLLSD